MEDYGKIKAKFTSFIVKVIENSAINYKKKLTYITKREIYFTKELEATGHINNNTLETLDEKINYINLENVFTNDKHFCAMKRLNNKEKLVLYLTVIEELSLRKVAQLLDTTEDNVGMIKYRAKNKFKKYFESEE